MTFDSDSDFANSHLQAVIEILKQNAMHLLEIKVAPEKNDMEQATDLVVTVNGGDVAVRVRRASYGKRYRDLTIRAWRASGAKTELHKIKAGFARWYLYGWADSKGGLRDWLLVDLGKLRASGLLDEKNWIPNRDGQSSFLALSDVKLDFHHCLVAQAEVNYDNP